MLKKSDKKIAWLLTLLFVMNLCFSSLSFGADTGEKLDRYIGAAISYLQQKGANSSGQVVAMRAMTEDPELEGLVYGVPYSGAGSYSTSGEGAAEAGAAIDQMAMNKNPRAYERIQQGSTNREPYDLIAGILNLLNTDGSFTWSSTGAASISEVQSIHNILALEMFYGGQEWESSKADRTKAIEFLLSQICDSTFSGPPASKRWKVEGGRHFAKTNAYVAGSMGTAFNNQCAAAILLCRWLEDDTLVEVNGEEEALKDIASRELQGILKTIGSIYSGTLETPSGGILSGQSTVIKVLENNGFTNNMISAYVAAGQMEKVNQYGLISLTCDRMEPYIAADGSFEQTDGKVPFSGIVSCGQALSEYKQERAILSTLVFDPKLNETDTVLWDLDAVSLPGRATGNLVLPEKGRFGSAFQWMSSNEDVINSQTGEVQIPEGQQAIVKLTVTATFGETSREKDFFITVSPAAMADQMILNEGVQSLRIPLFTADDTITLPADVNGCSVKWESGNSSIINIEGAGHKKADAEQEVLLTATISYKELQPVKKQFSVTVGIDNPSDKVTKAVYQARAYYDKTRDLSAGYWDVWAAKAIFGDSFNKYNFKYYNVKNHRPTSNWAGTDYGAVILQILAQGDNPYHYQGVNYVDSMMKYINKNGGNKPNWGAYGEPIFLAMALDASGAMTPDLYNSDLRGILRGQLSNLSYGPDLAGWAMVPLANHLNDDPAFKESVQKELDTFKETMISRLVTDKNDQFYGLVVSSQLSGYSHGMSNTCLMIGADAMKRAGVDGFDLTRAQDGWMQEDGTGIIDAIYKSTFDNQQAPYNAQMVIAFGDWYYGDNVWRSVGITHDQFKQLLAETKQIAVSKGSGEYTEKSLQQLQTAYQAAMAYEDQSYGYGKAYFDLKEAYDGLKPAGTISMRVLGNSVKQEILPTTYVASGGSYLDILSQASKENSFSQTISADSVTEIDGLKANDNGSWYCYNGEKRIADLTSKPEEGAELTFKYCSVAAGITDTDSLDMHLTKEAAKSLAITGAIDSQNNVTGDIHLPSAGLFGTTISWLSNKTFAVSDRGKVTRDPSEDISVKLTATVSGPKGSATAVLITVNVKSTNDSPVVNPDKKIAHISITGPKGENWKGAYPKTAITIEAGETAFSLLEKTGVDINADKNTQYGVYVRGINGLSEFDRGQNSGWMYRVNGSFPGHSAALERVRQNDYVEWIYTTDLGKDVGGYVNGIEEKPKEEISNGGMVTATTDVTAKTGSEGKAVATVSSKEIFSALEKALTAVKEAEKKGLKDITLQVEVAVKTDSMASALEIAVPSNSIKEIVKQNGGLKLSASMGSVSFDGKALSALADQASGSEVKLAISKVDISKNQVLADISSLRGRPVYELTAVSGVKAITDFREGTVTLSLPYTLNKDEKESGLKLVYIDEKGAQTDVEGSAYNSKTKVMEAKTNHFSWYAVTYGKISFADVKEGDWFYQPVMYLAKSNIVKGTTETTFSPDDNITRAEFVQILYSKNGKPESSAPTAFADVKDSHWFAGAVNWAAASGIVSGSKTPDGDMVFDPGRKISRQDMAVILARYLDKIGTKKPEKQQDIVTFADQAQIAAYAKEAVVTMQQYGIISGVKGENSCSFNPMDSATRAEASSMLAVLFQK